MVHHIRTQGGKFAAKENSKDNREHMFAFMEGLKSGQIVQLAELIHRWQDVPHDHCMENLSCFCLIYESLSPPLSLTRLKPKIYSILLKKLGNANCAIVQRRKVRE
jgi:hypothetical protein